VCDEKFDIERWKSTIKSLYEIDRLLFELDLPDVFKLKKQDNNWNSLDKTVGKINKLASKQEKVFKLTDLANKIVTITVPDTNFKYKIEVKQQFKLNLLPNSAEIIERLVLKASTITNVLELMIPCVEEYLNYPKKV
jgi:hypothetical protein